MAKLHHSIRLSLIQFLFFSSVLAMPGILRADELTRSGGDQASLPTSEKPSRAEIAEALGNIMIYKAEGSFLSEKGWEAFRMEHSDVLSKSSSEELEVLHQLATNVNSGTNCSSGGIAGDSSNPQKAIVPIIVGVGAVAGTIGGAVVGVVSWIQNCSDKCREMRNCIRHDARTYCTTPHDGADAKCWEGEWDDDHCSTDCRDCLNKQQEESCPNNPDYIEESGACEPPWLCSCNCIEVIPPPKPPKPPAQHADPSLEAGKHQQQGEGVTTCTGESCP